MREKTNSIRIKRKTIVYFVAAIITLATVTPVLADYLGPDRTVTETVDVCKVLLKKCSDVNGVYKYKTSNTWSCSLESKPWKSYPSSSASCNSGNVGYQYWTTSNTQKEVTNTYPPATVSSELQNCTLNNSWCNTVPQLVVSGDEPVLGYDIFAIEGSLNGQNFACSDDSCIVPLKEGNNTVDYWALSSWGDSSTKGTFTTKVDSQAPNLTGTVSGTSGSNGWYLSPISINGFASDATSGLANFTCALDGTALGSCSSVSINDDGPHTLVLTASDNAGNIRTLNQSASIDTQNPTLTANLNGTLGSNSWYTAVTLNASASDPTPGSGLAAIEYNLDNSSWAIFPTAGVLSLPNGKHTLELRAIDNAGRSVSSSKTFWLDSAIPDITLNPNGTLGTNNWYTTSLNLSASTTDETSGVDVFEYSLDNNSWQTYTIPLTITDGVHNVSFWSQDQAGLVKQVDSTFQVDTHPPQIAGNISGVSGSNGWYISDVTLSASASDPTPGSGLDAFTYILNSGASTPYTDPVSLSDGQHTIQFTVQDQAGLVYSIDQNIKIDTVRPALTISSTLPSWVKDTVTLNGIASDSGSGLSKTEISTDAGQNWQSAIGTTSWTYDWNTQNAPDGSRDVRVRITDQAGLTTEQTINVKIDNHAPQISLPASWLQWSSVTLDIWDDFSGVAEARVEISDPENRYPKRVIELDPNQFPLSFKWDRRFGNNEVAPSGTYDVKVITTDNLGHTAEQTASVKVVLSILPSGPTSTPQSYLRATATPIPMYTNVPISSPTVTPTAVISGFGQMEPTAQATSTPVYIPTPRATPTQTSILDWFESFFVPDANSKDSTAEFASSDSSDSRFPDSNSNILWGAAAAAVVGAATSYAQEERRKQQEEKERQAALEKEAEERHDKIQARKIEKADAQRKQEAAWEAARNEQQDFIGGVAAKLDRMEAQEEANWIATQAAIQQKYEEKKRAEAAKKAQQVEAKIAADDVCVKPDEAITPVPEEKSWWQKAMEWVDNHQVAASIGIGLAVGVGALAIIATGGLATPLVVGGAALLAGGLTAGGTMALNAYYDRPLNQNLVRNVGVAVTSAVVTSAATTVYAAGQQVVTLAATNTSMIASAVGKPLLGKIIAMAAPAVGAIWSSWMLGSLGAIGYGAATNADHTLPKTEREEGAVIGAMGAQSLDAATNLYDAANLANTLSPFGETAKRYGTAAANALAEWDSKTLKNDGAEIALRSDSDADVIQSTSDLLKLKDFNNPEADRLITAIGENSRLGDGDTFYIGKWVDYDNGYVGDARTNDGMFYNTNPQVYKMLKANIKDPAVLDDILWRINHAAVKTPIAGNMSFKYSLDGCDPTTEVDALQALKAGDIKEVVNLLGKVPARMQEVQALMNAGYTFDVNPIDNTIPIQQPQ